MHASHHYAHFREGGSEKRLQLCPWIACGDGVRGTVLVGPPPASGVPMVAEWLVPETLSSVPTPKHCQGHMLHP